MPAFIDVTTTHLFTQTLQDIRNKNTNATLEVTGHFSWTTQYTFIK